MRSRKILDRIDVVESLFHAFFDEPAIGVFLNVEQIRHFQNSFLPREGHSDPAAVRFRMDTILFHKCVHPLTKIPFAPHHVCTGAKLSIKSQYNAINDNSKFCQACQVKVSKLFQGVFVGKTLDFPTRTQYTFDHCHPKKRRFASFYYTIETSYHAVPKHPKRRAAALRRRGHS